MIGNKAIAPAALSSSLLSMSMANTDVSSLLVPIDAGHLLFPENMVAELIDLQNVVYHTDGLAWINLHGVAVPLLSLYQLCPDLYEEQAQQADQQNQLAPAVTQTTLTLGTDHTPRFTRRVDTSMTEKDSMVLILHTLLSPEKLPLLALRVTGSPHQVSVNHETLQEDPQQFGRPCVYIASHVRVANLPCVILDLPAIEQSLLKMMPFSNSQ